MNAKVLAPWHWHVIFSIDLQLLLTCLIGPKNLYVEDRLATILPFGCVYSSHAISPIGNTKRILPTLGRCPQQNPAAQGHPPPSDEHELTSATVLNNVHFVEKFIQITIIANTFWIEDLK